MVNYHGNSKNIDNIYNWIHTYKINTYTIEYNICVHKKLCKIMPTKMLFISKSGASLKNVKFTYMKIV